MSDWCACALDGGKKRDQPTNGRTDKAFLGVGRMIKKECYNLNDAGKKPVESPDEVADDDHKHGKA